MKQKSLSFVFLMAMQACAASVQNNADGSTSPEAGTDSAVTDGATTDSATTDSAPMTDSRTTVDAGTCVTAADCSSLPMPADPYPNPAAPSAWSCIVGRCTFESRGNRTCETRPDGCIICSDGAALHCPTSGCNFAPRGTMFGTMPTQGATCMRPDGSMIETCFGDFVRLRDGTLCSLRYAPTGAPIVVMACGGCMTSYQSR